jgi:hypothetical protein
VASSRVTETLIGVGFGVLGLVSIIFSLLFLVLQWAWLARVYPAGSAHALHCDSRISRQRPRCEQNDSLR